jgi:Protein of unknown function (DUF1572).
MSKVFLNSIQKVLLRDLDKLEKEISLYPDQNSLWVIKHQISNSAGNLCLHLCGNLQHFIGAILGGSGYVRDRDKEFSTKDVSAKDLVLEIIATKQSIKDAFAKLDDKIVENPYPVNVFGEPMTTQYFLIHLTAHLSYHLGQVNYHRRLVI